jgi:hypothetical protein
MSDVTIRVGTTGTAEAQRELTRVGSAGQQAQKGAMSAQQGFSAASAAASAAGGNIQGLAAARGQMLPRFQALQAALPAVGLAMAAFAAWKKVIDELNESQERLAKGLRDTQADNFRGQIDMLARAYKMMTAEIAKAGSEQQAFIAQVDALASAQERQAAAELRIAKAVALKGAKSPEERERVEQAYAVAAAQDSGSFAMRKSMAETAALDYAGEQAGEQVAEKEARLEELMALMAQAIAKKDDLANQQANAGGWTPKQQEDRRKQFEPDIQKQAATIKTLEGQISDLGSELEKARETAAEVARRQEVVAVEREAARAEGRAAVAEAGGPVAGMPSAAEAGAVKAMQQQLEALEAQKASIERQAEINTGRAAEAFAAMGDETQAKIDALVAAMSTQFQKLGQAVADQAARLSSLPSP